MDETIIRACFVFFYVVLEDDELIYPSCEAVITAARRKSYKNESESLFALAIREATSFYSRQSYKSVHRPRAFEIENPVSKDLRDQLKKLESQISSELYFPFLWQEVVKAPPSDVSQALKLSLGTLDYRSYEVLKIWSGEA